MDDFEKWYEANYRRIKDENTKLDHAGFSYKLNEKALARAIFTAGRLSGFAAYKKEFGR